MDAQQFLDEFGYIANAPNGISQLRQLVLVLAMQGRLLSQVAGESAISLLEAISAEKQSLITSRSLRPLKPLPTITRKDEPHALPTNWCWIRFGEIANHNSGKTLDSARNSGIPRDYITTSNLYWGRFDLSGIKQMLIREEELERCTARKGDLLICEGGEAGRAAVWVSNHDVCFQNHVHRARFFGGVNAFFAYRFFEKLNMTGEINAHRKGIGISSLSSNTLSMILFPLPPLEEQSRIVAKVDELMTLCDQLEKQQLDRRKLQNALRQSTLQALADAQSPHELQAGWQRLQAIFGCLFSEAVDVNELQGLVRDLAIRGLLTEQYATSDETESDTLTLLDLARDRLRKAKGIRASRPVSLSQDFEEPFQLPSAWKWVSLDQICYQITDGAHHTPQYVASGVPFLSVKDISGGLIDFSSTRFISEQTHNDLGRRCKPERGDVLLTKVGTTGIAKAIDTDEQFSIFVSIALLKFPHEFVDPEFLELLISSPFVKKQSEEGTRGIGNKNLVLNAIKAFAIPLPPLPDQRRILNKSNQLLGLCQTMKAQLHRTTEVAGHLATASVASLTGIAMEQEEEALMKAPQTELVAPLRLSTPPDVKVLAPLATLLARHDGELSARDLWQRFGGEIDAFYAQLKTEVSHGWIAEPAMAEVREKANEAVAA